MPTGKLPIESEALVSGSRIEPADVGLGGHRRAEEAGFTLATMVVIMAVMAVALTVAVQTVTFQRQREKEQELIFRGNQIVEAIRLFRARNGRFPISLEELPKADPRVVRKVWDDPITGKPDWVPVFLGQEGQVVTGGPTREKEPAEDRDPAPETGARGPIIGVHSRSCATAIKVLDGRTRYCEWRFVFDQQRGSRGGPTPPPGSETPPPSK